MTSHTTHANTSPAGLHEQVTPYHWLVVIIASAGWLFDCMDQRLFILARESALRELLGDERSQRCGASSTAAMRRRP